MKEPYQLAREARRMQQNDVHPDDKKEERKKKNELLWEEFDRVKGDIRPAPKKGNVQFIPMHKPSTPEEVIADRKRRAVEKEAQKKQHSLETQQQKANKKLL